MPDSGRAAAPVGPAPSARDAAVLASLGDGRRISGFVDDRFGPILDGFVANFRDRKDVGAACAIIVDGQTVVDVWGGLADARSGAPWNQDTAAVIFSCTKGVVAILAHRLVEAGRLDLDVPIARYWPEFAEAGKDTITLREAMAHRSGLAALDADLTVADVAAWTPVIRAIERQPPAHVPTAGYVYHTMTYGWIVGEVIRRVTGARPGEWLRDTVADPLGVRLWIGLPQAERRDIAWMEPPLPDDDSDAARLAARIAAGNPAIERAATMGRAYAFPADGQFVTFNDPALQAAEIPGANGIATATSMARLYAACVSEDVMPRLLSEATITNAIRPQSSGRQLTGMPDDGARWGTGFQIASPPTQPMLGPTSFGHAGAGGQLAFGDLDTHVGFAWLGNQMGGYGDERARSLTVALRGILGT
jgi:CubicO group peptidase (beta-lactamase class C family)